MSEICIISPSLKIGGIERALVTFANYFSEQGHVVTFISCLSGDYFYKLNEDIRLLEPSFTHRGGLISALRFYPRLLLYLRQIIKKENPEVVLAFGDWFCPLVLLALYKTEYPVYISDRTSPDYKFKFPIPILKKWLYPTSNGFIAQTVKAANYKKERFGNRLNIEIIPNAIKHFVCKETNKTNTILYVGRFAWEKAPERLVKAFAAIEEKGDWRLKMAGTGPLLADVKALAKQLSCSDRIDFLGQVSDVQQLYCGASIYVLPSVLEGFPNALCEAMTAGLACICFETIPYEAILENGESGIVVEDANTEALTLAIARLMNKPEERERLGRNARIASQCFRLENVGEKMLDFILDRK